MIYAILLAQGGASSLSIGDIVLEMLQANVDRMLMDRQLLLLP